MINLLKFMALSLFLPKSRAVQDCRSAGQIVEPGGKLAGS